MEPGGPEGGREGAEAKGRVVPARGGASARGASRSLSCGRSAEPAPPLAELPARAVPSGDTPGVPAGEPGQRRPRD